MPCRVHSKATYVQMCSPASDSAPMKIDGHLLRRDREDLRHSRSSFLCDVYEKTGIQLSLSTLRRAESGEASRLTMKALASGTGFPAARYDIIPISKSASDVEYDLNGEWRAHYFEDDLKTGPYGAVDRLFIKQSKNEIRGIYEKLSSENPEGYLGEDSFIMEGVIMKDIVMGRYYVDGRNLPRGAGVFQLMLLRNGSWAEGACTFLGDDGTISVCVHIWTKYDSPEFDLMQHQVKILREQNFPYFKMPISRSI